MLSVFCGFCVVRCARWSWFTEYRPLVPRRCAARQREGEDVRARRSAEETAAAGGDDHILPAVLAEKGHRRNVGAGRQFRLPQLLAGLRFEGAEAAVDRGADEDDAAGGGDAAADVERAGVVEAFVLERLKESERNLPRDVALVHIERDQLSERAGRARNLGLRIPEPADRAAPRAAPHPRRHRAA